MPFQPGSRAKIPAWPPGGAHRPGRSGEMIAQGFCEPVRNVVPPEGHVIGADVLDSTFALGEDLQFPSWAVGQRIERLLRVLERDLTVFCSVRDEEGHP